MKKLYSIKDTKGSFYEPQIADNDALAVRAIRSIMASGKGLLAEYPEDFELWLIGTFDEVTGIVTPCELACVCRLSTLVNVNANA